MVTPPKDIETIACGAKYKSSHGCAKCQNIQHPLSVINIFSYKKYRNAKINNKDVWS